MNGVKYFGGHTPDQVVAYGSAVISAAGSGLSKSLKNSWKFAVLAVPGVQAARYEVRRRRGQRNHCLDFP